jgi:hypothetical protein
MRRSASPRLLIAAATALLIAAVAPTALATHGGTHIVLQTDTKGCTGVLPSTDGNTDMQLVGGTLRPGGTAVFAITYPLNASSVGKEFTITACAFINDVAQLKYLVSFVPSNQSFVLRMTFAIPDDAPVGGEYCNYAKTTRSPTAAQASQRKAGPACFIIRGPIPPTVQPPSSTPPGGPVDPPGVVANPGTSGGGSTAGGPVYMSDTATRR